MTNWSFPIFFKMSAGTATNGSDFKKPFSYIDSSLILISLICFLADTVTGIVPPQFPIDWPIY